ncbi:glycoside hydrolase family 92 protein [Puteibacter caeruleilacunae]|nr:glycoside hydrolase family 92 protein [Puteibacter caeruleilacunae]
MLKRLLIVTVLFAAILTSCKTEKAVTKPVDLTNLVNPLVGSESTHGLSTGNTYPAIAVPWGMNFWTPQTGGWSGWLYQYQSDSIRGIQQCHQPSPWIANYASFTLMPVTGKLAVKEQERQSKYSHDNEVSLPHYYSAFLDDYQAKMEVTTADRGSIMRFTFPESNDSYVVIDGNAGGNSIKIIPEKRQVIGYTSNNHGGVPDNFKNYFVIQFDKDFADFGVWNNDEVKKGKKTKEGKHAGAYIQFATKANEEVHARIASSFISFDQAKLNLKREIGDKAFDQVKAEAADTWNKELNRFKVEGGSVAQQKNFYTALYRTMLFPRKFWEVNAQNEIVHYSPYNGEVLPGYMYTDNGFWDTFRAVFPFFTVFYPELNAKIMEGLANTYKESGWLPEWASPGHRNCMIGSNSASLIADSYLRGIRGYDIETLYEAILKNSENPGPLHSVGRLGAEYYNTLGYVPCDVKVKEDSDELIRESAARTLEYAYADFTIWKLAQELGRPQEEIDRFKKRAQNYKNLFDPSVNFMRGKQKDGNWMPNFDEFAWGGVFTEGSSWHYTWSVFQDPKGLIQLMGGQDGFLKKMDAIFTTPPKSTYDYYGFKIHEIVEMEKCEMGQYAHGNQPIQHAIYLYNWTKNPWKAQKWSRITMDKLYKPTPDGLCGDEDNGQTSAWYVFSAMGMYPVCPGTGEYALGSPLFDKITMTLENGNTLEIVANNQAPKNYYITDSKLNGKSFTKNYFTYEELQAGGKIEFNMSNEPNKQRGIKEKDFPYSMTK